MIALLALMLATVGLAACEAEFEAMPSELIGIWRSDHPRYKDRIFEVRADQLVFGTGEFGAPRIYALVGVRSLSAANTTQRWQMTYRENDGEVTDLELVFTPAPTAGSAPTLTFGNRAEVWKRAKGKVSS